MILAFIKILYANLVTEDANVRIFRLPPNIIMTVFKCIFALSEFITYKHGNNNHYRSNVLFLFNVANNT